MDCVIKIFGQLTDFNNNPIPNGTVEIKDANLSQYVYITNTDGNGMYELQVKKGAYLALAAVKDYSEKNLEYWCWNLQAYDDTEINMKIDGLEIYALNAFMIQRSRPNNSIMIYFRPMSLKKYKNLGDQLSQSDIINISPNLEEKDIDVKIDNQEVSILECNKVIEKAVESNQQLYGYLIQVTNPKIINDSKILKIDIQIKDSETNEFGMGSLYWEKPAAFDYFSNKR